MNAQILQLSEVLAQVSAQCPTPVVSLTSSVSNPSHNCSTHLLAQYVHERTLTITRLLVPVLSTFCQVGGCLSLRSCSSWV